MAINEGSFSQESKNKISNALSKFGFQAKFVKSGEDAKKAKCAFQMDNDTLELIDAELSYSGENFDLTPVYDLIAASQVAMLAEIQDAEPENGFTSQVQQEGNHTREGHAPQNGHGMEMREPAEGLGFAARDEDLESQLAADESEEEKHRKRELSLFFRHVLDSGSANLMLVKHEKFGLGLADLEDGARKIITKGRAYVTIRKVEPAKCWEVMNDKTLDGCNALFVKEEVVSYFNGLEPSRGADILYACQRHTSPKEESKQDCNSLRLVSPDVLVRQSRFVRLSCTTCHVTGSFVPAIAWPEPEVQTQERGRREPLRIPDETPEVHDWMYTQLQEGKIWIRLPEGRPIPSTLVDVPNMFFYTVVPPTAQEIISVLAEFGEAN